MGHTHNIWCARFEPSALDAIATPIGARLHGAKLPTRRRSFSLPSIRVAGVRNESDDGTAARPAGAGQRRRLAGAARPAHPARPHSIAAYRGLVGLVAAGALACFVPSLAQAGVPVELWPQFTLAAVATAALLVAAGAPQHADGHRMGGAQQRRGGRAHLSRNADEYEGARLADSVPHLPDRAR